MAHKKMKVSPSFKRMLRVFKKHNLEAAQKRYSLLKKQLLITLQQERFVKKSNHRYRIPILRLIRFLKKQLKQKLLIIILSVLCFPNVAFAAGSSELTNEIKLGGALAMAGIATVSVLIIGTRYMLMGNTASGLIGEGTRAGSELLDKVKTDGSELLDKVKTDGNELLDKGKNDIKEVLGADNTKELIDQLMSSINPLTQIQIKTDAAKAKMELFLKKILTNSKSNQLNTNKWVDDLEEQLSSLGERDKAHVTEGLQNILRALEKDNREDINKAFADLTEQDMEQMADYVCVSLSRPNSSAGEMFSIMEPLCNVYYCIAPALTFALLMAPFSLYLWIRIKQLFVLFYYESSRLCREIVK